MDLELVNRNLRGIIQELLSKGFKKTHIGQTLLGPNGQANINHYLKKEDSKLGIAPLSRVADVMEYSVHIVFVPNGMDSIEEYCDNINREFFEELLVDLQKYLSDKENNVVTKPEAPRRNVFDNIIDRLVPESTKYAPQSKMKSKPDMVKHEYPSSDDTDIPPKISDE